MTSVLEILNSKPTGRNWGRDRVANRVQARDHTLAEARFQLTNGGIRTGRINATRGRFGIGNGSAHPISLHVSGGRVPRRRNSQVLSPDAAETGTRSPRCVAVDEAGGPVLAFSDATGWRRVTTPGRLRVGFHR